MTGRGGSGRGRGRGKPATSHPGSQSIPRNEKGNRTHSGARGFTPQEKVAEKKERKREIKREAEAAARERQAAIARRLAEEEGKESQDPPAGPPPDMDTQPETFINKDRIDELGLGSEDEDTEPEDIDDPPEEPEPTRKEEKPEAFRTDDQFWGYGAVTPFNSANYSENTSHTNSQTQFKKKELLMLKWLRGAAATILNEPDSFVSLPKIVGDTAPTKWMRPYNGTIRDMMTKMGFSPGNIVKVCHYSGFAKVKGQSLPGGVTIEAGKYKGRRAILPGMQYGSFPYNVSYSYRSDQVYLGITTIKSGVRLGKIGGKPRHGVFLITDDWIKNQLSAMYGGQVPEGTTGTWYDLERYFIAAQKAITDKGQVFQLTLTESNALTYTSKVAYIKVSRAAYAYMKKLKKLHPQEYSQLLSEKPYQRYLNTTGERKPFESAHLGNYHDS